MQASAFLCVMTRQIWFDDEDGATQKDAIIAIKHSDISFFHDKRIEILSRPEEEEVSISVSSTNTSSVSLSGAAERRFTYVLSRV